MNAKTTTEEKKGEPRGFSVTLAQIGDGRLHSELSEELHALVTYLEEHSEMYVHKAKGALTLVLSFEVENGACNVKGEVKTKKPKGALPASHFFVTKEGHLSIENPRQTKLPLRDVSGPAPVKDIAPDAQPVRTI